MNLNIMKYIKYININILNEVNILNERTKKREKKFLPPTQKIPPHSPSLIIIKFDSEEF